MKSSKYVLCTLYKQIQYTEAASLLARADKKEKGQRGAEEQTNQQVGDAQRKKDKKSER